MNHEVPDVQAGFRKGIGTRDQIANNFASSQGYGFSSVHVWMWKLDCEESWAPKKNWCFWTVVLEKTIESPLDCKEIQPVLNEISPGCLLVGLMLKLKLQYFGHKMWRADSFEKTLTLGKIEGMTEDEMVGWHHGLDGHEFEQALGVGDG